MSIVWSFHSQWSWCGSIIFYKVHSQCSSIPGSFRALFAADKLFEDFDVIFQQDLYTVPKQPVPILRSMASHLFNWPGNSENTGLKPHLKSMGYCKEEDEGTETLKCRRAEGRYQSNLGYHNNSTVSKAGWLHCLVAVAKGGPTKYWGHNTIQFWEGQHVFKILFYWSREIFLFCKILDLSFPSLIFERFEIFHFVCSELI